MDYLEERDFSSVVLMGHGFGGIWMSNYLVTTQDKRLRGLAYIGPPRDSASWLREGLGAEKYDKVVAEEGRELVALLALVERLISCHTIAS